MAKKTGLTLFLIFALALALAGRPAEGRGLVATPWNLAIVAADSPEMKRIWLGGGAGWGLRGALELELRALPLRVWAGLWAAEAGGAALAVSPANSAGLKGASLKWRPSGKHGGLAAAVKAACRELTLRGGGSIVLLAAGDLKPGRPGGWRELIPKGAPVFCHTVAVGKPSSNPALEDLAMRTGGAYFHVSAANRLRPVLSRAVLTAICPSRLLIWAHGPDNKGKRLIYDLQKPHMASSRRKGLTGRPLQLMAGVYSLGLPKGADLGPGPAPSKITVAPTGLSTYWVGGYGDLAVYAQDAKGNPLDWKLTVYRIDTGHVEAKQKKAPVFLRLASGRYMIKVDTPPRAWPVQIKAGKDMKIITGPRGSLRLSLKGPSGPLRVPYQIISLQSGRKASTGYTNSEVRLLPGAYRLKPAIAPEKTLEVEIGPGRKAEVGLPAAGGILVDSGVPGESLKYSVFTQGGREIATGAAGRELNLWEGVYTIWFSDGSPRRTVTVPPGGLVVIKPGS